MGASQQWARLGNGMEKPTLYALHARREYVAVGEICEDQMERPMRPPEIRSRIGSALRCVHHDPNHPNP